MRTPRKGIWLLMQPRSGARVRLAGLFLLIKNSILKHTDNLGALTCAEIVFYIAYKHGWA